jgi:tetratricopeptide (TPR) repeat protein
VLPSLGAYGLIYIYSFSKIYWIDGTSPATMEASIASIASDEDARSAGGEANLLSILRWLGRCDDNWLMIFDGADVGYEVVEGFIPPGKHGNILISSRNMTMNRLSSPSSAYMEVVELDEHAAVELFIKSAKLGSPSPAERDYVDAIVRELCCLALAVDQAASSIATGICRIDEYLDLYKRHRLQLMDDALFKGSSNYGRAVYTSWDISFAELKRRSSALLSDSSSYEAAILILRLFSFFHFDGIHEEIFSRAAETTGPYLDTLQPGNPLLLLLQQTEDHKWDSFTFRAGIRILSQFSLIKSSGMSAQAYSVHRLVHGWMQDRLPKSCRSKMALLAAIVLARSEDDGESAGDYAHRRALLVHLITLSGHLKQAGLMNELSVDTMERMAQVYRQGGKPTDAEALLHQAISLIRKDNLEATKQYIDLLAQLAHVLWDLGRLREAETFEQQVLEWREKHLGTNDKLTAAARNNLATTLHDLGELGRAKELRIQVLDWRKEHLGMDHPHTYQAMANLAATFRHLGEFVEAKELDIQVLDWRKEHLGMDHPYTYRAMANLAATLRHLGEFAEAKELDIQVLDWRKEHLGMDHPYTYRAIAYLAATFRHLGKFVEAKELEIQVLDWRKEHLGMDHPHTYQAMTNLAVTFRHLGEFVEARELEIQVLDWRKEHLGVDHPDTYEAIANLAATFRHLGEFVEARELEIQVLDWRKEHLGMDHPHTYQAMFNLAVTLRHLGEFVEAKELGYQVLDWQKEHLGMCHPETYSTMADLAVTLCDLDELSEAKELEMQVLDWRKVHLGLEHPETSLAMENLGYTLRKLGEVSKAEELFAQVRELDGITDASLSSDSSTDSNSFKSF